jgi:tetratricopeptide (TPR) repeat protein
MMRSSHSPARSIGALGLVVLLAGCGMSWEARKHVELGWHHMEQNAIREALASFREAARHSPDSAEVQLALGEAAEILGEFDQALSAYQAAARRSPSTKTWVRVGRMADRMGNVNLALQALEAGYGTWRQHAWEATKMGTATFGICTSSIWPAVWMMWTHCLPAANKNGGRAFDASREQVPQEVFSILVEAGPRERALAYARGRNWLRDGADYCRLRDLAVSYETTGLLAMLVHPERAACLVDLGTQIGSDGLVNIGRMILSTQVAKASNPEDRKRAEWFLRYRLPDHQVPKIAESLNVTGYRLQHRLKRPVEAVEAFQKAIAADPMFSWPYNNIGLLYLNQNDDEQALAWFTKAIEINPNHLRAIHNQGRAAHKLKRYDQAATAYSRTIAIDPTYAEAHANLGRVLIEAGRQTEGYRELQVAVSLDPSLEQEQRFLNARFGRDARQGPTPYATR